VAHVSAETIMPTASLGLIYVTVVPRDKLNCRHQLLGMFQIKQSRR